MKKVLKNRNQTHSKLEDYVKIVNDNVSISSADVNGTITSVSDAFCKYSGYSKEELLGKPYNLLRKNDISDANYKKMWKNLQKGIKWTGEIKATKKCGEVYWAQALIHPEYKNNEIISYTVIKHDITEKKRLEHLSITDDLTGLYNRRYFNRRLEKEINRARRNNIYLSFLLLDIDFFKKYNDTYGHPAGDEALKKVGSVFKKYTNRACDLAFRVGGEEFCLIFSSDDTKKSLEFANLIKRSVNELFIEHSTSEVNEFLTVSIGLFVKKGLDISTCENIYKEADEALYKAKQKGRNRVYLSDS